jgi:phosphocarrier protein
MPGPPAQFVKIANSFPCDIRVEKDDDEVDGKSILGLMMLAAGHGSVISVTTEGDQENEALAALGDLIEKILRKAQLLRVYLPPISL